MARPAPMIVACPPNVSGHPEPLDGLTPAAEVRSPLLRSRCGRVALVTEADASALEIVWRHFDDHTVANSRSNAEFAHLAGSISEHLMFVVELHPEIAVGQNLGDRAVELQQFFFRHPVVSG